MMLGQGRWGAGGPGIGPGLDRTRGRMTSHPRRLPLAAAFTLALVLAAIAAPLLQARAEDIETTAQTLYIVDYQTGAVLADKNSTGRIEPASLTKMMTA